MHSNVIVRIYAFHDRTTNNKNPNPKMSVLKIILETKIQFK